MSDIQRLQAANEARRQDDKQIMEAFAFVIEAMCDAMPALRDAVIDAIDEEQRSESEKHPGYAQARPMYTAALALISRRVDKG